MSMKNIKIQKSIINFPKINSVNFKKISLNFLPIEEKNSTNKKNNISVKIENSSEIF